MKRILVIEDELEVRANILELLEFEEFEAFSAENGVIGVQLAQQELPDLILCDVMMPGMDGYGVLQALRQDPETATIPFIFLTAKASKGDLRLGMELGADDYLTKPFTGEELLTAIKIRLQKQATITERYNLALKQAAERLNFLVNYDSVTNLPNQRLLQERFNRVLETEENWNNAFTSGTEHLIPIFVISVDRFSWLREILGATLSEALLKSVAERLKTCINNKDTLAYLGAEQFAVISTALEPLKTQDLEVIQSAVAEVTQAILEVLSEPFILAGRELFINVSMGIALYPQHAQDIDRLVRYADTAMQQARKQGGNSYHFYTATSQLSSLNKLELEASLHHALERCELKVYYQPQIDFRTGCITGAEALVRWQHPEQGMVSPADFIPLAEETGLITTIDQWVLQTACQQTKLWHEAGFSPLHIAVNLSAHQFSQSTLSQKIAQILQETGLEPGMLELELTESTLVQNPEAVITIMGKLGELGVKIAIDDFGTGYSSLNYLQQFPFNTLKIDRCFVQGLTENSKNAAITMAIIQMAHNLKLQVVAEGVETSAELLFLRQHECDTLQGYLFSPALPTERFTQLLTEGKRLSI